MRDNPKCELCGSRDRVTPDTDYTGKNLCYYCWNSHHEAFLAGFQKAIDAMERAKSKARAEIESQSIEAEDDKSAIQKRQDLAAAAQCRACKYGDAYPDDCAICSKFTHDEADAANVGECPRFERRPKE